MSSRRRNQPKDTLPSAKEQEAPAPSAAVVAKEDAPPPSSTPTPTPTSYTLTIPHPDTPGQRHFLVNFPGYVRNEQRALSTFGGLDSLAAQRDLHAETLHLRLRPGDPASHALISDDVKPSNVFVLKISRPTPPLSSSSSQKKDGNETQGAEAAPIAMDVSEEHEEGSKQEVQEGVPAAVSVEIVSRVVENYSFSAPADFQYAGRDLRPTEVQWVARAERAEHDPEYLPRQPLLCSPPLFAVEPAIDYSFRQYKAGEQGIGVIGKKARKTSGMVSVDYFAALIPPPLPTPSTTSSGGGGGGGGDGTLAVRVAELLNRRPVYLEAAMGAALREGALTGSIGNVGSGGAAAAAPTTTTTINSINTNALLPPRHPHLTTTTTTTSPSILFPSTRTHQELLARLCYKFRNGPWKGALIRRGYDPRTDPSSRQYQVLEYTLPADWWKKVLRCKERATNTNFTSLSLPGEVPPPSSSSSAAIAIAIAGGLPPLATTYTALCAFSGVQSTQSAQMQLCDIDDEVVRGVLADACNVAAAVSDAQGWLTQGAWEGVKKQVGKRFEEVWASAAAAAGGIGGLTLGGGGGGGGGGGSSKGNTNATAADGSGSNSNSILPAALMQELTTFLEKSSAALRGSRTAAAVAAAAAVARGESAAVASTVAGGAASEPTPAATAAAPSSLVAAVDENEQEAGPSTAATTAVDVDMDVVHAEKEQGEGLERGESADDDEDVELDEDDEDDDDEEEEDDDDDGDDDDDDDDDGEEEDALID